MIAMIRLGVIILSLAARACSNNNLHNSAKASVLTTGAVQDSFKRSSLEISGGSTSTSSSKKLFKVVQVHVIHRHGDRTPITPLKNEEYWRKSLPSDEILDKIAQNTKLIRNHAAKPNTHAAGGRGAFGKLTQMGLFQMVKLGHQLREELVHSDTLEHDHYKDKDGNVHVNNGCLFHPKTPLDPKHVKVVSTDFARTIQSVQGVLLGLFPDNVTTSKQEPIEIDVRHTHTMIPDPQPRHTLEQVELELQLAQRPHLKEKEVVMRNLAIRATEAMRPMLGEDAFDVSFGVGEEKDDSDEKKEEEEEPLPWAQLAEITKCLQVRNMLPKALSEQDQQDIASHAAWRWFENLRHERLAHLAMSTMVSRMLTSMHLHRREPLLHLYSAHDSTLIALICAYRLQQPSVWPEYGSYLKIELVQVTSLEKQQDHDEQDAEYYVRFSLNGQVLQSDFGNDNNNKQSPPHAAEMIPLSVLNSKIGDGKQEDVA